MKLQPGLMLIRVRIGILSGLPAGDPFPFPAVNSKASEGKGSGDSNHLPLRGHPDPRELVVEERQRGNGLITEYVSR